MREKHRFRAEEERESAQKCSAEHLNETYEQKKKQKQIKKQTNITTKNIDKHILTIRTTTTTTKNKANARTKRDNFPL